MNKEVEYLKEHLYEIYKYKKSMKDLTYDMDIEHLLRTCKALDYQQKEVERLNNIINKGKIYCEDVIQEHENGEYNVSTTQLAIEEHKKNIMSLLNILNGDLENYWRSDKE